MLFHLTIPCSTLVFVNILFAAIHCKTMSSQRRRRALQRQPSEGELGNAEEEPEVVEGVGEGAETAEEDGFMDDVDEPLSVVRTYAAAPSGEDLFKLALNCKF